MKVVLVSTYDLGHQPFALASPAAWLRDAGHEVTCADITVAPLPFRPVREADLVAFHLPMHTATRLAVPAIEKVRAFNPEAHLCCYGLYAPLNEDYLRKCGVKSLIGGEFEQALLDLANGLAAERSGDGASLPLERGALVTLDRLQFRTPDRAGLPGFNRYTKLHIGEARRRVGYTEASRGCKHLCRHCPVVPVYNGVFRVVQQEVVLADIRQQVAAGAEHITFGDPDFFNGPAHAVRIIEAFHREFPGLKYDVTIKIEHLLRHRDLLPVLRRTGCLFVTSAVESSEDEVLEKLAKGHTRADFIAAAEAFREAGLTLCPTFVPFTPWTTQKGYRDLLRLLRDLDLVENVSPIQLVLRLLVTAGSRLLDLPEMQPHLGDFDEAALTWRWRHPDPPLDALSHELIALVGEETKRRSTRREVFAKIWEQVHGRAPRENFDLVPRAAIPYMDEPWYC